jgi:Fe-S-cluster containining protein
VWVNKAEIEALAAAVAMNIEEFERKYVRKVGIRKSLIERRNGDCVFFDSKSRHCDVYRARPRQCRTWPFWESNLQTSAAWQSTVESCPGCDHGHLYPLEEIERRVSLRKV